MNRIIKSRNKREGHYAGWRVTGGRNTLNWNCRQINHERTRGCVISLREWARQQKGGRP